MFFDPGSELGFGPVTSGEVHHHGVGLVLGSRQFPAVCLEEEVHENEGHPLIAIDEGVIQANVVAVGRGLGEAGFVDEGAPRRHLGLGEVRLEQAAVPQTRLAAVALQQVGMDDEDEICGEEPGGHYLARALSVFRYLRLVRS